MSPTLQFQSNSAEVFHKFSNRMLLINAEEMSFHSFIVRQQFELPMWYPINSKSIQISNSNRMINSKQSRNRIGDRWHFSCVNYIRWSILFSENANSDARPSVQPKPRAIVKFRQINLFSPWISLSTTKFIVHHSIRHGQRQSGDCEFWNIIKCKRLSHINDKPSIGW